jgi:hypothetical protein
MSRFDLIHIHPAATRDYVSFMFIPAGLFGVLNEVREAGYTLLLLNEPLEMAIDKEFDLHSFLKTHESACYSIDIHWHEHLYGGLSVAGIIKSLYPGSTVIVGGLTASFYAEEILRHCSDIDVVISGYGEGRLPPLIESIRKNREQLTRPTIINSQAIPDIDELDLTTWDYLHHAEEYLKCSVHYWDREKTSNTFWLKNGFGCAHNCPFCGGSQYSQKIIFGNGNVIYRSAENLANDLVTLDRQGVQMTSLTHDIGAAGASYWRMLHRLLRDKDRTAGIYFEAEGLPSYAFLEDFAKTYDLERSVIALSPLCENETLRGQYGKRFGNHRFWSCLRLMKKLGIQFVLYFISSLFDYPLTNRTREKQFQERLRTEYNPLFVFNSFLTLDPGSPMYFEPNQYGVEVSLRSFEDYLQRGEQRSNHLEYDKFGYEPSSMVRLK